MPDLVVHAAFVYHNPILGDVPLPAGVLVRLRDRDLISDDDTLAWGHTDGRGQVTLRAADRDERRPDLYLEVRGEGRRVDLARNRVLDHELEGHKAWRLPARWTSISRFAKDYTPGLQERFEGDVWGSPTHPVTFRLTFDAFLRFVRWDEAAGDYAPVPAGTVVRAWDAEPFGLDRVLAEGHTRADGRVHLRLEPPVERHPDLYVTVDLPGGRWSSREAFALGNPDRSGYWQDFVGSRIGRADNPYIFDVGDSPPGFVPGNAARALIDGPETLAAIEDALRRATRSIHVEVMFLFNDPIGRRVAALLCARARAGVRVRVMFDRRTTADTPKHINLRKIWVSKLLYLGEAQRAAWMAELDEAQEADRIRGDTAALIAQFEATPNLEFVDASFPYVEIEPDAPDGAPALYRELEDALPAVTVARIDHRKMLILDGREVLLGGMNIGQEYLYTEPIDPGLDAVTDAKRSAAEPWVKWRDCFVHVQGPAAREAQRLFRERWITAGGAPFDAPGQDRPPTHPVFPTIPPRVNGLPVRIVNTTPGARMHIHAHTLSAIDGARRRICIANAYFSSQEVAAALERAARRGVDVLCIFPGGRYNDSLDFFYSGRMKYAGLMEAGARIYEQRHHMAHSKIAVIDDDVVIGSANYNQSSFFKHYEINAVVRDRTFADDFAARYFTAGLPDCVRIQPADVPGLLDIHPVGKLWLELGVNRLF
ncbi:MAG: phosphatidylserine/phosphatidylglycerophosphate/cardiolipin synthase family protein [Alphaproteobacteria bacterium]|nr:phosphatidylserine/phosphatidylglycerophosphate/cardiolipin synthase family protein [Alphaproteobacteria bacterium]